MSRDFETHRCPDCGRGGLLPWQDRCPHSRACEARQMLQAGATSAEAAAHAQRLPSAAENQERAS